MTVVKQGFVVQTFHTVFLPSIFRLKTHSGFIWVQLQLLHVLIAVGSCGEQHSLSLSTFNILSTSEFSRLQTKFSFDSPPVLNIHSNQDTCIQRSRSQIWIAGKFSKSQKWQRRKRVSNSTQVTSASSQQCRYTSALGETSSRSCRTMDIPFAKNAIAKSMVKSPTRRLCPNSFRMVNHPCPSKSR